MQNRVLTGHRAQDRSTEKHARVAARMRSTGRGLEFEYCEVFKYGKAGLSGLWSGSVCKQMQESVYKAADCTKEGISG